ncbi:P-loop containing nucleoside triphosphate hydrolase protein [Fimicolochytrium jonesii]|uniref:P-loop containing nucleoside triphosphate hydrolase protein n=1 Tax=Fimicolochytrium jonesii TaxID=1396493 RepID=UPI0022FE0CFA|nr:P-loop containing nucleoside triphosphate hydrolase protein [Fimicolochytrium jonesii]KAI8816765.1 P-loop containing nucleoside triphosphate hydrolase protein [Fimicolochytrium jonesii]
MWAFTSKERANDVLVKIMLLGDSGVGKSQIFQRILRRPFSERHKPTVGIDFGTMTLKIASERILKAQVVDTSGLDRYRSITQSYWSLATGVMVVYDITSKESFQRVRTWVRDFQSKHTNKAFQPVIMIVGNHSDKESLREVPRHEAQAYALANTFLFSETSAFTNTNIDLAFNILLTEAYYALAAVTNQKAPQSTSAPSSATSSPTKPSTNNGLSPLIAGKWRPQPRTSSLEEGGSLGLGRSLSAASASMPSLAPRHRSFDERVLDVVGWIGREISTQVAALTSEDKGSAESETPAVAPKPVEKPLEKSVEPPAEKPMDYASRDAKPAPVSTKDKDSEPAPAPVPLSEPLVNGSDLTDDMHPQSNGASDHGNHSPAAAAEPHVAGASTPDLAKQSLTRVDNHNHHSGTPEPELRMGRCGSMGFDDPMFLEEPSSPIASKVARSKTTFVRR